MGDQRAAQKTPQRRSRNVQMIVRATQKEKDFIMQKMRESGIQHFNLYALKMLIVGEVKNVDLTHYRELAKEVSRIGVNINQIAKVANAQGRVYKPEIKEVQERMADIWRLLKSSLSELRSKKR